MWVANQYSASLSHVDPATNTVTKTSATDGEPASIAMIGNTPWVATAPGRGGRGGTLRLLHSRTDHARSCFPDRSPSADV